MSVEIHKSIQGRGVQSNDVVYRRLSDGISDDQYIVCPPASRKSRFLAWFIPRKFLIQKMLKQGVDPSFKPEPVAAALSRGIIVGLRLRIDKHDAVLAVSLAARKPAQTQNDRFSRFFTPGFGSGFRLPQPPVGTSRHKYVGDKIKRLSKRAAESRIECLRADCEAFANGISMNRIFNAMSVVARKSGWYSKEYASTFERAFGVELDSNSREDPFQQMLEAVYSSAYAFKPNGITVKDLQRVADSALGNLVTGQ